MVCSGAIAGLITGLTLASAGAPGVTVIGTEADFAPYIFQEADGSLSGFDHDVAEEVCQRARLTCKWQVAAFDALIPGVIDGRFDMAISGIAVTPERDRVIDYTLPYTQADGADYFVGRPDAPPVDAALIGVQSGTIHAAHLRETGRRFRTYPTEAAMLAALVAGEVDRGYGPFNDAAHTGYLEDHGLTDWQEETIPSDGVAMVVCQGNDDLRRKLDGAIKEMQADGTLNALSDRWFQGDDRPSDDTY